MADGLDDLLGTNTTSGGDGSGKPSGKDLRSQLEQVLAQNAALTARLEKTEKQERDRSVRSIFEKHSIPSGFSKFFPTEGDPEEVAAKFIEENGELWGHQAQAAVTDPAAQAGASAMQQVSATSDSVVLSPKSEDDYRSQFAGIKDRAEFERLVADAAAGLAL